MTSNLVGLEIQNFKNIGLVELQFDTEGGVFSIMGANGAGKSSVLDAVEAVLGGKQAPKFDQPIKEGEEESHIIATFDDLVVTRKYNSKGTSIDIRNAEGLKYPNASVLEQLYSKVAIDPYAFSKLDDAEQVTTLLKLIGYDPAVDEAEDRGLRADRVEKGRERDRLKGAVTAFPDVPADTPDAERSVADLSSQLEQEIAWNGKHDELTNGIVKRAGDITVKKGEIEKAQAELAALEEAQAEAKTKLEEVGERKDTAELSTSIATAETVNAAVRNKLAKAAAEAAYQAAEAEYSGFTSKIEAVVKRKQTALAGVTLPAGLTLDAETFAIKMPDGSPFSQASSAEKVKIGFLVGLELAPNLKLMAIRDGSLLDTPTAAAIDALAREHGMTVLLETVNESAEHGVRLVEGAVAEVRA